MPDDLNKLIFVVGYPRSGTTMMASWLSGLPSFVVCPETHFFNDLYASHLRPARPVAGEALVQEASARRRFSDLQLPWDQISVELAGQTMSRQAFFELCLSRYRALHGAEHVVEKTPEHLFHLPTLMRLFPEARVVAIVRDMRDCLLSLHKVSWSQRADWQNALEWGMAHRLLYKIARRNDPRLLIVHYDAFISQDEEKARVANFVGCDLSDWSPDQISTGAVPVWEQGWKSNATGPVTRQNTTDWRSAPEDFRQEMEDLCGDELRLWGFEAQNSSLKGRVLRRLFPVLPFLRRWRIKLSYGTGLSKDLPSERFLKKVLEQDAS